MTVITIPPSNTVKHVTLSADDVLEIGPAKINVNTKPFDAQYGNMYVARFDNAILAFDEHAVLLLIIDEWR